MPEGSRIRAFLAVPADVAWAESALRLGQRLRAELPPASWTRPPSWHLTIKFLGEMQRTDCNAFARAISPAAAGAVGGVGGELRTGHAEVFPRRGAARVLGVGLEESAALSRLRLLAEKAQAEGASVGVPREDRPFAPHVTLARLRRPWPPAAVDQFCAAVRSWAFPPWPVAACVLYESRLEPQGAVHTELARWDAAATGAPVAV